MPPLLHSGQKNRVPGSGMSDRFGIPPVSTQTNSRKRAASPETYSAPEDGTGFDSDDVLYEQSKRLKKSDSDSESPPLSPMTFTKKSLHTLSRKLSFSSEHKKTAATSQHDSPTAVSDPGIPVSSGKRIRRPSEKAKYLDGRDADADAFTDAPIPKLNLKQLQAKVKGIKTKGEAEYHLSDVNRAHAVKTEPVDDTKALQPLPKSEKRAKGKQVIRFASPIDISSGKSDVSTPKAKPAIKHKKLFSRKDHDTKDTPSTPISVHNLGHASEIQGCGEGAQMVDVCAFDESAALSLGEASDDLPETIRPLPPKAKNTAVNAPTAGDDIFLENIVSKVKQPSFAVVPFDNANSPAACPAHLLYLNDDGSASPLELVAAAFDLLGDSAIESIYHALKFEELRPFVNVTSIPRARIYAEKFRHHVMWSGQNCSVIFTMLGSVQACHLVEPTTVGPHVCKSITIIPYGEAWQKFQGSMGQLYGQGLMRGPFKYGCLLTFSGRRKGYTSQDFFNSSTPVTPKKNSKAFGKSGAVASAEWYDSKLPNCVNFDKTIPIYDASKKPFLFGREDFLGMPSLPLYKSKGQISDLPVDAIVSVFFAMSSYTKKNSESSSSSSSSAAASFTDTLSLNIHYVIYHGVIPYDD